MEYVISLTAQTLHGQTCILTQTYMILTSPNFDTSRFWISVGNHFKLQQSFLALLLLSLAASISVLFLHIRYYYCIRARRVGNLRSGKDNHWSGKISRNRHYNFWRWSYTLGSFGLRHCNWLMTLRPFQYFCAEAWAYLRRSLMEVSHINDY